MNLTILSVTKNESKQKLENLPVQYDLLPTQLGTLNVAHNPLGVCHLSFHVSSDHLLKQLKSEWPKSHIKKNHLASDLKHSILKTLDHKVIEKQSTISETNEISIVLKGTTFQIQVWRELTKTPFGAISNYSQIATALNRPKATRAIGNAIACNPIAILIPCHRIIRKDGHLGGYRWGKENKINLLKLEGFFSSNKLNFEPKPTKDYSPKV